MALDIPAVVAAVLGAYLLRFDGVIPEPYWSRLPWVSLVITVVRIALLAQAGLYQRVWAYASLSELMAIVRATAVGSVVIAAANVAFQPFVVPRSVLAIEFILSTAAIGGIRVLLRVRAWDAKRKASDNSAASRSGEKRILVIGAGDAGAMAVREILASTPWIVVGFIDDDPGKQGQRLYGVQVLGGRHRIPEVVQQLHVTEILIAIPSASRKVVRELVDLCRSTGVDVRILPALYELIDGRVTVNHIREVRIEDLLGREPVKVDISSIAAYLAGRRVLITGAGGSIGSELCRQVARYEPEELILMGHGENSIFEIDVELAKSHPALKRRVVIGDIRDVLKVRRLFQSSRPDVVFHAAAHKHVPLMEGNPEEAVTNNIFGTLNLLASAMAVGVERFILISTDKAVEPTSVMGASKRVAEMLIQTAAAGELYEVIRLASEGINSVITASRQGKSVRHVTAPAWEGDYPPTPSFPWWGLREAAAGTETGGTSPVHPSNRGAGSPAGAVSDAKANMASTLTASMPEDSASAQANEKDKRGMPARGDDHRRIPRYVAVRFGNVLGSRGSVVQVFKRQIAQGGPVTVTDPEMRRYFMTTAEAVQLVIQAGALGEGGEVFVLDMGEPVRILDLALDMIRLSGLQPETDIPIQVVGSRPGEKMCETLIGEDERVELTRHPKILRVHSHRPDPKALGQALAMLRRAVDEGCAPDELRTLVLSVARGEVPPAPNSLAH